MVLLLTNTARRIIKKLYLIYYFIIFSIYWTVTCNPFNFNTSLLNYNDLIINNINFNYINILYLFLIELLYFLWSYISYKTNLSDWHIPIPTKSNLYHISNIFIFYFGLIIYFYIFNNISS